MSKKYRLPVGELVLRTLAMPANTNVNGDISGGWIMSQMDIGGAILAKGLAECRVITAAVNGINFLKPISVGDVVSCYARSIRSSRSSITVNIEIWVKNLSEDLIGQGYCATEAVFIYVAIDDQNKSRTLPAGKKDLSIELDD
ncbi:acyl-CoA thioester hydrolase YciA [Candidatus Profftia tarda]|uniref:Acyl-CoA thioester hydrolase YciA n=1 Tax=Candidatus Profftia tarda TaxID=1177216 RepID=A0A8E4EYS7_9ENTR|nr:acyl-CoA thioester hydrolase YciA [Candidatus Profftia tarda]CAD6512144.1 Acyl-CoA thioester hydrolase YciA [Candidatus Profftia tarda]